MAEMIPSLHGPFSTAVDGFAVVLALAGGFLAAALADGAGGEVPVGVD
jgi:hypothetical protein